MMGDGKKDFEWEILRSTGKNAMHSDVGYHATASSNHDRSNIACVD